MCDNENGSRGAVNTTESLTDAPDYGRRPAMDNSTARPAPRDQLTLIASIAGSARDATDEQVDRALWRISRAVGGDDMATILDLEMQHRRHGND